VAALIDDRSGAASRGGQSVAHHGGRCGRCRRYGRRCPPHPARVSRGRAAGWIVDV